MNVVRFAWAAVAVLLPACNAVFGIDERPAREKADAGSGSGGTGGDGCAPDCFPPAPADWSGPVLFGGDGSHGAAPSCGGLPVVLSLEAEPTDGDHTCPCNCAPATGVNCMAQVTSWLNPDCTTPLQVHTFAAAGQCLEIDDDTEAVSVAAPVIDTSAAGCVASPATPELPPAAFARRAVGCDPGDDLDALPEGFASCIHRPGDHPCPGDIYTERSIWYAGVEDTRGCLDDCSCGAVTGQCDVQLLANGGHSCNESDDTPILAAPLCVAGFFDSAKLVSITPSGTCEPGFATPTGAVRPIDPTTVCCQP